MGMNTNLALVLTVGVDAVLFGILLIIEGYFEIVETKKEMLEEQVNA